MKRDTDYLQQLANYIKKNLSEGYTLESLKWALVSQGYGRITIDKAISLANEQLAANAPRMIEKPVIKIEKVETIPIEEKKGFWKKVKDLFN